MLADGTHPFQTLTKEQHEQKYKSRSVNYTKEKHPFNGKTGMSASNVKMTPEKLKTIRNMLSENIKMPIISRVVELSYQTVCAVKYGKIKYD